MKPFLRLVGLAAASAHFLAAAIVYADHHKGVCAWLIFVGITNVVGAIGED